MKDEVKFEKILDVSVNVFFMLGDKEEKKLSKAGSIKCSFNNKVLCNIETNGNLKDNG